MLFTGITDMVPDLVQVAMIHRGEQVMLNLHVETSCEEEHKIVISSNVMGGENLVLEKVFIELVSCVRGQMVNLTGDHEANREEVDWQNGEEQTFHCQTVQDEWENMHNQSVKNEPDL